MEQKDQQKSPKSPTCTDCGQTLAGEDKPCPDCPKPSKKSDGGEVGGKARRRPGRRAALIAGLVILLICLAGLAGAGLLGQDNSDPDSTSAEQAEQADQQAATASSQSEAAQARGLDEIVADEYEQCQAQRTDSQHLTGFQEAKTCSRRDADGLFNLLLIQQMGSPNDELVFKSYNVWCKDELGRRFSIIRGERFVLTIVNRIDLDSPPADSVSEKEYLANINQATGSEFEYLREQGLQAELVNACDLEELRP